MTSRLLINEPPLQVLPSLACAIGLNNALFIQQVHYWLCSSKHEHEGRRWVYNTMEQWNQQFPFWTVKTIQRIIAKLEDQGVLLADNFNAVKFDRTKWYSLDYARLDALIEGPPSGQVVRMDLDSMTQPIPETTTPEGFGDSLRSSPTPHENDDTPYLVLEAFLEELGSENVTLGLGWKRKQLAVAKRLIEDGFGVTKVRRCTQFMLSESWRTSPFDLFDVEKNIGKWEARGAPEHEGDLKSQRKPHVNDIKNTMIRGAMEITGEQLAAIRREITEQAGRGSKLSVHPSWISDRNPSPQPYVLPATGGAGTD